MRYDVRKLLVLITLGYAGLAQSVEFGGGGSAVPPQHDQVPQFTQMNRVYKYWQDRKKLVDTGRLKINKALPYRFGTGAGGGTKYSFPLKSTKGYPGYHGTSGFVDLNPSYPNHITDYHCGNPSYDLNSGYNHRGIDFFTWPYEWYKMDNDEVQVVAAEAGTITTKIDGNYDRVCSFNDPKNTGWNAVYITHADGSYAWYGHLKKNSLTSKPVGATVQVGEYLGIVGSSGTSTGPHLHFETHDASNNVIEPHFGTCNSAIGESWWRDQRPYYDSAINQLMTHAVEPSLGSCPGIGQTPNAENVFSPGDRVYMAAYYRDQLADQNTHYEVLRPNGTLYSSWNAASSVAHYNASYWYWYDNLPVQAMPGRWTFKATYEGQVVEHHFWVDNHSFDDLFSDSFE